MNVFDLVAKITLDKSEYDDGLKESGEKLQGFGGAAKKALGTAAKIGGAAIATIGAAGAALTKTVLDGAAKTAAYGDNVDKMSQKMGISAQAYQEWDAILQHSGSSIDGMQRGMMTLALAAENNSDAFKKLGISEADLASMNQEELFSSVISGLQGMEEGTERAALAQQLLGGAAKELGPLLNTSAEETEAMRQAVHDLGGVMSDEAVKSAAAYQDSLQDMQTAFSGLTRGLFSKFMPSITKIMDGLSALFTGGDGLGFISEGIDMLVSSISDEIPKFVDTGLSIVMALGDAVVDNAPKLLGASGEIIGKIVAGIISATPELIKQIPEIIKAIINGLKAAWPEIKSAGYDLLVMLWNGIKAGFGWLSGKAEEAWDTIQETAVKKWEEIKEKIKEKLESLRTAAAEKLEIIRDKVSLVTDSIKAKFEGVKAKIDTIKQKFENFRDTVSGIWDTIKGFFSGDISLPNIPLPHFKIVPEGWTIKDLVQGIKPTLTVEWYAKAYDNPYMFTKPTVMTGFGDGPGGEMVYGRDNLMRDIREASGANSGLIERIVDLLEDIARNGLNANIGRSQVYQAVSQENRTRTKSTNYNLLAAR